jgi:S-adenosylmethionine:diacylglycerol 3-amino-3-carboxypropyl transferase
MRKEFKTSFWQRAYEGLPAEIRAQYLTQIQSAERWELATAALIEALSRAKNGVVKLFQTPSPRAH